MTKLCDPGEDMLMDGDEKENPTGTGVCQGFFRKKNITANEAAMEGNETEGGGEGGAGNGGTGGDTGGGNNAGGANSDGEGAGGTNSDGEGAGGANSDGAEGGGGVESEGAQGGNKGKATVDGLTAGAPAPQPAASPEAGGGADGAGGGGEAEGDAEGDADGDAEGASEEAAHLLPPYAMKEDTGLREQGFEGPNIEHDDMKTHTSDWRKEYGPNHPNYQRIVDICLKHPKNPWCRSHLPKIRIAAQESRLSKSIAEQVASSMFVTFLLFLVQIR